MRPDSQSDFDQWWDSLTIPGHVNGAPVERDAAAAVWQAARAAQQDRLSLLQEHAEAHAELARTQPLQDAAFIADRFHGGRLTYSVAERSDWQAMPKRIVRVFNSRTNAVTIAVAPDAGAELDGRPA
jgi:hypothetical protein